MVDGSYREAFGHVFERAMGSLLRQVSEQFMAWNRVYDSALERRM